MTVHLMRCDQSALSPNCMEHCSAPPSYALYHRSGAIQWFGTMTHILVVDIKPVGLCERAAHVHHLGRCPPCRWGGDPEGEACQGEHLLGFINPPLTQQR